MPLQLAHVITLAWPFGVNIMSIMNCLAARVGEPPHPAPAQRCLVMRSADALSTQQRMQLIYLEPSCIRIGGCCCRCVAPQMSMSAGHLSSLPALHDPH